MSQVCELCSKTTGFGNKVDRRGLAKAKGGVGIKTTGITKRKFRANIQRIRVTENGTVRRMRICTQCIRKARFKKAS
jgi:large subunit ribosomal protein L28